ncbi:D-glycero-beta-D-manno-heptose 1-phosphate adenylyltransferase [Algivirga pacifica]|uniref:D-glycero-beta-D-manno-heptose 1-phosphate adenylyltransferase n=1 Tax=Algivirga pacifica TaxID=1162670 RepID=A0ABP9D927_9BACT
METKDKIMSLQELLLQRAQWKKNNEKVVFTNGCFDILHLGHIDYLEKARHKGERLIIGVNTDESVQRLKGPQRPINNEYARSRMLAALAFVDAVILFGEETPLELIQQIIPDILVKGNDYTIDTIVGADVVMTHGGTVETIELVEGFSTTSIIEKIQKG